MKYFKAILSIPLALGLLYGCNANEGDQVTIDNAENNAQTDGTEDDTGIDTQTEGQTQQDENGQGANETNQGDNSGGNNTATDYNFTHFDLDVDYAEDKSYEAEFTNNQKGMSAELDDDINNVHSKGDEAHNELVKHLELLTFTTDSDPQDVLSEVITAFDLDENYKEFDLEVRFTNGEVKEYNFTK